MQSDLTDAILWLTNSTVLPLFETSCILPIHLFWNSESPTANTSSIIRISESKKAATAKASLTYIPEEYLLTGVPMYLSTPEKLIISSSFFDISDFDIPKIAPFRKIFSLPVNSGWKPVPTSNKLAILPLALITPVVGFVTLDKSLSKVDFPAPFLPIIPNTSPSLTSKLMSFNAHTYFESPEVALSLTSPTFK